MYRRDGSAFINSLHIFPIFVKFPGDDRGFSTGLSTLLEEYILPPDASSELQDQVEVPATLEAENTVTDPVHERPFGERNAMSNSDHSDEVLPPSTTNKAKPNETRVDDMDRLSLAKPPVVTTLSNGHQYVSSDIPNKVAYIALQFSIIQDLRN